MRSPSNSGGKVYRKTQKLSTKNMCLLAQNDNFRFSQDRIFLFHVCEGGKSWKRSYWL